MNTIVDYKNRQLIPRWYPYDIASLLGETGPVKVANRPKIFSRESYSQKEKDWLSHNELIYAIEFVGTALIANDFSNENAIRAAEFIIKNGNKTSNIAVRIAEGFLNRYKKDTNQLVLSNSNDFLSHIFVKIASLKRNVRDYHLNPISWIDLGFFYTCLGQLEKAERCVRIAINLAPENRFILRSSARFYSHLKEPDTALYFLRRSSLLPNDPWLIASEISISEAFDFTPRFAKKGKTLTNSVSLSPKALSELFGTIGTLELNHGSAKKAKKLFRNALIDPNENTVAQAVWIGQRLQIDIEIKMIDVPFSFEAEARLYFRERRYKDCIEAARKWLQLQPYSSRPAVLGSYAASLGLQDENEAIKIIQEAQFSSPNDFFLNNNHAFSLATIGDINGATDLLRKIDTDKLEPSQKATLTATLGLIGFKMGNIEKARELYSKSLRMFKRLHDDSSLSLVYLFSGREEAIIDSQEYRKLLNKAKKLATKTNKHEVIEYALSIEKKSFKEKPGLDIVTSDSSHSRDKV